MGTKHLVNGETSAIIVGTGSCRGKEYVFLPNRSLGVRKSSSGGIRQNERIGSRFRDDARAENRGWEVRPSSSGLNDPVFGLGFVLEQQNFAWTGHLASRQSLANKNMDSPETQPYPL